MSKKPKRKIVVEGESFVWVLDKNSVIGNKGKEHHIRVYLDGQTNKPLYIDPTPWEFEIRPKTIGEAIEFAMSKGWNPKESTREMYISMQDDEFYVLPTGIKFGYQTTNQ